MNFDFLQRLPINDDVDAEFTYWKNQLVLSAWLATGFALATGILIGLWPPFAGDAELRGFARHFWTVLAECAFWFGFLLGLLWAAAKRIGSSLSGSLPWQARPPAARGNSLRPPIKSDSGH